MSKQSETKNGLFLGLENFISSLVGVVVIILCSVHCGFQECVQIIKVITIVDFVRLRLETLINTYSFNLFTFLDRHEYTVL